METSSGPALVASETVEEGAVVERLEGRVVPYSKIPDSEIRNAFEIDDERWMIPQSPAKHINHSCDPNCELQRTSRAIWVVALRDIREGEELTHRYNYEYDPEGYRDFPCFCGANNCVGYIVDQQYWELITQQRYQFAG